MGIAGLNGNRFFMPCMNSMADEVVEFGSEAEAIRCRVLRISVYVVRIGDSLKRCFIVRSEGQVTIVQAERMTRIVGRHKDK